MHISGLEIEFLELQDKFGVSQSVRFPYRHIFSFCYLIFLKGLLEISMCINDAFKDLTIHIILCGIYQGSPSFPES